jgi:hypothetical protein
MAGTAPEADLSAGEDSAELRDALDPNSTDFLNFVIDPVAAQRCQRPQCRRTAAHDARGRRSLPRAALIGKDSPRWSVRNDGL